MRRILLILSAFLVVLLFVGAPGAAHEQRTPIIVDTDMALDDVRAITLLLSSHHVAVSAFVTSDGSSSPEAGYDNLRKVLAFLGKSDIPIGVGRQLNLPPPPWRGISEALGWADLPAAEPGKAGSTRQAVPLILDVLSKSQDPVSYVCLGPLTNLADVLRVQPSAAKQIASVFYYGLPPTASEPGWNTSRDKAAAELVCNSGIPFYAMHLTPEQLLTFDVALYQEIAKLDTKPARLITLLHRHEKTQKLLSENHFIAWDETVALYLDDPALGVFDKTEKPDSVFRLVKWDRAEARADYPAILSNPATQALSGRTSVVLKSYPTQPSQFQEDLSPLVPKIIALYGLEEWQTTLLTNELHRHLGIYSILGAKMGIRARELFSASLDELAVESFAGLTPPLSCLNDGLQVATGASLGRGTIRVEKTASPTAEAVFIKGSERLRMRLKDEIRNRIRADIQRAIQQHGDLTPEYFKEVRRLSLQYWAEMNRREIFEARFE
jgi:pyrimidine-specific ribonucleoside hydrolase